MRILVTGASGFIGQEVCHVLLSAGHRICGIDHKERPHRFDLSEVKWRISSLLDREQLGLTIREFRPEVIVHLAAKANLKKLPPDGEYFAVNVQGAINLMEVSKEAGVRRAIFASTKYVCREDAGAGHRIYSPATSYGESKVLMEEGIWNSDGGCPEWAIIRPTTVWGPGMSKHYQGFLRAVRKGRYFHLGTRPVRKSMSYVANIARQIQALAEVPGERIHRRIFYLADREPVVLEEWAEGFRTQFGSPKIRRMPRALARLLARCGDLINRAGVRSFPFNSFRYGNLTGDDLCETSAIQEILPDEGVTMAEGISRTAAWFTNLPR